MGQRTPISGGSLCNKKLELWNLKSASASETPLLFMLLFYINLVNVSPFFKVVATGK